MSWWVVGTRPDAKTQRRQLLQRGRRRKREKRWWWQERVGEEDEGVNHGTNGANDSLVTVDKRLAPSRQKENNWLSITTKASFVNSCPGNVTTYNERLRQAICQKAICADTDNCNIAPHSLQNQVLSRDIPHSFLIEKKQAYWIFVLSMYFPLQILRLKDLHEIWYERYFHVLCVITYLNFLQSRENNVGPQAKCKLYLKSFFYEDV